jgi:ketosteroid isomerase-like protein
MSQENVEIAVGYFQATDLESAIDALANNVSFVFHGETRRLSGTESFSGKQMAIEWLADWFSRFDPGYRMEVNEARDWGDRVLVVTTHHARGRISAVPISDQTAQVMTVADGRIVRQEFFASRDEALEAAGLSE